MSELIAVSTFSMNEYGCPYCGSRVGQSPMPTHHSALLSCGACGSHYVALADGEIESPFYTGTDGVRPRLRPHPRYGIPSHGRPDERPSGGGEYFRSRGLGLDSCDCFVCGSKSPGFFDNIAAYVRTKEAGERTVALFAAEGCPAWLDFRKFEPDYLQVKIGACPDHKSNLEELDRLVSDGVITLTKIRQSLGRSV